MNISKEHYDRAARFYEMQPTGQYDDEAVHALRCHHELLEALEDLDYCIGNGSPDDRFTAAYDRASAAIARAKAELSVSETGGSERQQ